MRAEALIPERARNCFTDENNEEWISERQQKRMKLELHNDTNWYTYALETIEPNRDVSDTNRGVPTFNTPLREERVRQYQNSPFEPNSLLRHCAAFPAIVEFNNVTYDQSHNTVGASKDLHQYVDPDTYKSEAWVHRDMLKVSLNQREELEPTSIYHKVRSDNDVIPFVLGQQLKDAEVLKDITDKITDFLEAINANNTAYQDQKAEWERQGLPTGWADREQNQRITTRDKVYDSHAPNLAEQQITEIPIENVMNLYGIKIAKETPDEYWGEAYPKIRA
jgi:hypothetical protein